MPCATIIDQMTNRHTPNITILASGSGSTAEAFIDATQNGTVKADVGLVICNNSPEKAGVYDRIIKLNRKYKLDIPVLRISGITHPGGTGQAGEQTLEESSAIASEVYKAGSALVALMGYMKKVRGELLEEYGWRPNMWSPTQARMINTHPGPLPQTEGLYGIHVQEAVLDSGLGYSAHTVHMVSGEYDQGRIIEETPVPVQSGDTPKILFDRVQEVEKSTLPLVIRSCLIERGRYPIPGL
jgi:phosphoribosylglycinamide formyltransferase 1